MAADRLARSSRAVRAWMGLGRSQSDADDRPKSGEEATRDKKRFWRLRRAGTLKNELSSDVTGAGRPCEFKAAGSATEAPAERIGEAVEAPPVPELFESHTRPHHSKRYSSYTPPTRRFSQNISISRRSSSIAQNRYSVDSSVQSPRSSWASTQPTLYSPEDSLVLQRPRKVSIGEQSQSRSSRRFSDQWDSGNPRRATTFHFNFPTGAESGSLGGASFQGTHGDLADRRSSVSGTLPKPRLTSDSAEDLGFFRRWDPRPSSFGIVPEEPTETPMSPTTTDQERQDPGSTGDEACPNINPTAIDRNTVSDMAFAGSSHPKRPDVQVVESDNTVPGEQHRPEAGEDKGVASSPETIESVICPMRKEIVDRIMETFREMFDSETDASDEYESDSQSEETGVSDVESDYEVVHLHGGADGEEATDGGNQPSGGSSNTSGNRIVPPIVTNNTSASNAKAGKRAIGDSGSVDDDDDDRGGAKRRRPASSASPKSEGGSKKFACPYFKRSPHSPPKSTSCYYPGFTTVPRMKEHLYRIHRLPIHCQRCFEIFQDDRQLAEHHRAEERCVKRAEPPEMEGLTQQQEQALKCKKRVKGDNSEEAKWRRVYRVLFPDDEESSIPSPYCEHDCQLLTPESPGSQTFSRYEEFSRRRLPDILREEVERLVDVHFVEEQIRSQLVPIMRRCQEAMFAEFRNQEASPASERPDDDGAPGPSNPPRAPFSTRSGMENLTEMFTAAPETNAFSQQPPLRHYHPPSQLESTGPSSFETSPFGQSFSHVDTSPGDLTSPSYSETPDLWNDGSTIPDFDEFSFNLPMLQPESFVTNDFPTKPEESFQVCQDTKEYLM